MATIFPSNPTIGDTYNGYMWTGTAWDITGVDLTASYQPLVASVSSTELGYLDGVTSAIQTQLDAKSTASKTETLMSKTFNLTSNTLTGTKAQFNSALSDDDFVTINGTEYPKNKYFDSTNIIAGAYSYWYVVDTANGTNGPASANTTNFYAIGSTPGYIFGLGSGQSLPQGQGFKVANHATVSITVKDYEPNGTVLATIDPGQVYEFTYMTNNSGTGVIANWFVRQIGFSDGYLNLKQTATTDTDPLVIQSKNGHGGTNYAGIQTWKNTNSSATNPNKFWRMNATGGLELINSAYTASILSISDSGNFEVAGTINGATINNNGWSTFTPSLRTNGGSITLGNGTMEASYKVIGKTCHVRYKFTIGSTTSIGSGELIFGLPATAANSNYNFVGAALDNGNAWYQLTAVGTYLGSTTEFAMIHYSGTGKSSQGLSNASLFSLLSEDYITISGTYEVA